MTQVRIFQKPKNAMQSGRFGTDEWLIEYEPAQAKQADPLMGWAGSGDTRQQVALKFASLEAAKAYATSKGLSFHVIAAPKRTLKLQAYADNFK